VERSDTHRTGFDRHSGMVREHHTMVHDCAPENLEIPDRRFASSGMTTLVRRADAVNMIGVARNEVMGIASLHPSGLKLSPSLPLHAFRSRGLCGGFGLQQQQQTAAQPNLHLLIVDR
jgi:hypothetical protein